MNISDGAVSVSAVQARLSINAQVRCAAGNIQVYRDSPCPQVVHPQHTADNIATKIVKDKHLPDRLSIRVENRRGGRDQAIRCCGFMLQLIRVLGGVIEVQDLLD